MVFLTPEQVEEMIRRAADGLGEHLEAVQILASYVGEDGNTLCHKYGIGNWYARRGMAQEFIELDQGENLNATVSFVGDEDEEEA